MCTEELSGRSSPDMSLTTPSPMDLERIRSQFPALSICDEGRTRVYLDNPAGTQVPIRVLDRMREYLVSANANCGGAFRTSVVTDALLEESRQAAADLLNAESGDQIVFGPNMTTLTITLAHTLAHEMQPGDEIVVTRLDHDANVAPWLRIAEERQVKIRWLDFNPETGILDTDSLEPLLNRKTRLVAIGYASNLLGTINPVKRIIHMAHAVDALVFVDAVHYAPHGPIDVQDLNADFLVCSPYKFFGPHQGVLWGRPELLKRLRAYRVRPAGSVSPGKWETGTQSHESIAGTLGAVEYLAGVGAEFGQAYSGERSDVRGRRLHLHCGMRVIQDYERQLSEHLIGGMLKIPGLKIRGIKDRDQFGKRVPTVSFTHEEDSPERIARRLAEHNVYVWHGHSYAVEAVERMGLTEGGGVVRVGPVHYNSTEEIDVFLSVLANRTQ